MNKMNKNIVLKKRDTNWRWRHALGFKLIPSKKVYSRKKSTKGLSCVSILMKHLNFSSYFNENKESLFVRASRKRSVEYKIVKD